MSNLNDIGWVDLTLLAVLLSSVLVAGLLNTFVRALHLFLAWPCSGCCWSDCGSCPMLLSMSPLNSAPIAQRQWKPLKGFLDCCTATFYNHPHGWCRDDMRMANI